MADIESCAALRRRILDEHAEVRAAMARVLGARDEAHLLLAASALCDALGETLDDEEALLAPALRQADAWGVERARRLGDEHAALRAAIARLRGELASAPGGGGAFTAASSARQFVAWLAAVLDAEEREALTADVLRDDGITVEIGG